MRPLHPPSSFTPPQTHSHLPDDGQKLFRDFGLLPAGLVELGALAHLADPTFRQTYNRNIVALAKVVEYYTHKTLDKGKVRTSDWEAKLSTTQITYAANDAHCALTVCNVLMAIAAENETEVDWKACAADLEKDYRDKTAANASAAAAAPTASSPAAEAPAEDKEPELDASTPTFTPTPAPTQTQMQTQLQPEPQRQLTRTTSAGWNPFARPPSSSGASMSRTSSSQTTASATPTTSTQSTQPQPGERPRPQHMRAYNLWHTRDLPLADICAALRTKENPLAESTVMYVFRSVSLSLCALPVGHDTDARVCRDALALALADRTSCARCRRTRACRSRWSASRRSSSSRRARGGAIGTGSSRRTGTRRRSLVGLRRILNVESDREVCRACLGGVDIYQ